MECWIFGNIPGAHRSWTLAVFAVSLKDARDTIKAMHGGGKLLRHVPPGAGTKVAASCGLTTGAASDLIHQRLEDSWREYQRQKSAGFDFDAYVKQLWP